MYMCAAYYGIFWSIRRRWTMIPIITPVHTLFFLSYVVSLGRSHGKRALFIRMVVGPPPDLAK